MTDEDLLLTLSPDGLGVPLYCIHAISGSPYSYVMLGRRLSGRRPVHAMGAPGFEDSGEPLEDVGQTAMLYASLIRDRQGSGPLALLGWSFGGVVAHEVATLLQQHGTEVVLLALVDSICATAPGSDLSGRELLPLFTEQMLREEGLSPKDARAVVTAMPAIEDATAYFDEIVCTDSPLADLDPGMLLRRFRVYRAHVRALGTHRSQRGFAGRTLYVQSSATAHAAATWAGVLDLTWIETVPGDHYSIWHGEGFERIAAVLSARLDEHGNI
jgi:thioesterase domain-containing protein